MTYYAITVFVVAYAFIICERFNKTTIALIGAGLMVYRPLSPSRAVVVAGAGRRFGWQPDAVGSSGNIVMLGIALRSGNSISFWEFTRKRIVITAISTVLCAIYLWLRYFVLS